MLRHSGGTCRPLRRPKACAHADPRPRLFKLGGDVVQDVRVLLERRAHHLADADELDRALVYSRFIVPRRQRRRPCVSRYNKHRARADARAPRGVRPASRELSRHGRRHGRRHESSSDHDIPSGAVVGRRCAAPLLAGRRRAIRPCCAIKPFSPSSPPLAVYCGLWRAAAAADGGAPQRRTATYTRKAASRPRGV